MRRGQGLGTDWDDSQSGRRWIDCIANLPFHGFREPEAQGGEIPKAIAPNALSGGKSDECLRCAPMRVPVFLVLVPDLFEINGDARVPVAAIFGVVQAGKV